MLLAIRDCIRSSRIMKFDADVSSSISSAWAPASSDSCSQEACEVEPDAFCVLNALVSLPIGRLLMYGVKSTLWTQRPSSARILEAVSSVTT